MIEIICDEDSFFSFQRRNILSKLNARQLKLYNQINKYLEEYLKFYNIGPKKVIGLYKRFLKSYALDCKQFIETNYYPAGLTGKINELDRMEYDIILIISCLLSFHRFRIIDEISNYNYWVQYFLELTNLQEEVLSAFFQTLFYQFLLMK